MLKKWHKNTQFIHSMVKDITIILRKKTNTFIVYIKIKKTLAKL